MFEAWGRSLYRARRVTIVVALLFAVAPEPAEQAHV